MKCFLPIQILNIFFIGCQVESVSCYCRLDTGLKTVVDARKFVPGAKMCMQPEVKQSKCKSRGSRKERCRTQAPLLPGLPDDLAIACLIRVPRVEHPNLRMVCKRWNRLLSRTFFSLAARWSLYLICSSRRQTPPGCQYRF